MFRYYFFKVVCSPFTLLSAMILFVAQVFSSVSMTGSIFESLGGPLYSFQYVTAVGVDYYFIPVTTVLSVCYIQYEMVTKNAELFLLYRSTPNRYIISGISTAGISGMVAAFISFCLFILYSTMTGGAVAMDQMLDDLKETCFSNSPMIVLYLREAFIYSCNAVIWPVISFTVFIFLKNQYIAAALPFILRTASSFILQRLEGGWFYLDPAQLSLKGIVSTMWDSGILYMLVYITVIVSFCIGISYLGIHRRIKNG